MNCHYFKLVARVRRSDGPFEPAVGTIEIDSVLHTVP